MTANIHHTYYTKLTHLRASIDIRFTICPVVDSCLA